MRWRRNGWRRLTPWSRFPYWVDPLQVSYPGKPVHVITNGFDPDDFSAFSTPMSRYFTISYTGQLYEGRRDPTILFETVHELIEDGTIDRAQMRIRFYGPIESWVQPLIERYDLNGVVEIHGSIDRNESLRRQQESQILLLLGWANPQETGQHTGKLFEYFGSRRPILAVGGVRGVLTDVLEETKAGVHALSKSELSQFLVAAFAEFREFGEVRFKGNDSEILKYTHSTMAGNFAALFDGLCRPDSAPPSESVALLTGASKASAG